MKASDRGSGAPPATINDEIRALLEDPELADDVLRDLTSFFGGLGRQDVGNGETLNELLTISGVPLWELLQHELFQILEPELYRIFVAKAVVARHAGGPIVVRNENPVLTRAVQLCAPAVTRARVIPCPPSDHHVSKEERPRYPPTVSPSATPQRLARLIQELDGEGRRSGPRKFLDLDRMDG